VSDPKITTAPRKNFLFTLSENLPAISPKKEYGIV
jgi:hypothetical protein